MRIVIQFFRDKDLEESGTPQWKERTFSLEGAEEALGRLERFLQRQEEKEKLVGKDNNF